LDFLFNTKISQINCKYFLNENQEIDKEFDDYETFLELEQSDHYRMNEETKKFLKAEEGKQVYKAELKLALRYSQKSLKLSPDNPHYLDTLAEVYLKLGDKSKAKKANDQAKKIAEEKNDGELLKVILEREGRL
jgi:tetratricopeptide (TPR) repeat protein